MQSIRKREYGNNYADEQSDLYEKYNALKQSLIRTQRSKLKTKKKIPEVEEIDDDEYSAEEFGKEFYNGDKEEDQFNVKEKADEEEVFDEFKVSDEGEVANGEKEINFKSEPGDVDEKYEEPDNNDNRYDADNIGTKRDKKGNFIETKDKEKSDEKEKDASGKVEYNNNNHKLPVCEGHLLSIKKTLVPCIEKSKNVK